MPHLLVLASISETLVNETERFIRDAGLPGIFVLMALSCACIPIPSEAVMLFAGFAVADPIAERSEPSHDDDRDHPRRFDRLDGGLLVRLRASGGADDWS